MLLKLPSIVRCTSSIWSNVGGEGILMRLNSLTCRIWCSFQVESIRIVLNCWTLSWCWRFGYGKSHSFGVRRKCYYTGISDAYMSTSSVTHGRNMEPRGNSKAPNQPCEFRSGKLWNALVLSRVWLCDPLDCSLPSSSLCPWDFSGKNIGVGSHLLLQGILLTQRSNSCLLCLLYCTQILYPVSRWGKESMESLTCTHVWLWSSIK